jgi:Helix-turn-helix domain
MKRLQAFKFEVRPNGEQRRQMRRYAGPDKGPCFGAFEKIRDAAFRRTRA